MDASSPSFNVISSFAFPDYLGVCTLVYTIFHPLVLIVFVNTPIVKRHIALCYEYTNHNEVEKEWNQNLFRKRGDGRYSSSLPRFKPGLLLECPGSAELHRN